MKVAGGHLHGSQKKIPCPPPALNDSNASTYKRHCIEGTKHLWENNHLLTVEARYNKGPRGTKPLETPGVNCFNIGVLEEILIGDVF